MKAPSRRLTPIRPHHHPERRHCAPLTLVHQVEWVWQDRAWQCWRVSNRDSWDLGWVGPGRGDAKVFLGDPAAMGADCSLPGPSHLGQGEIGCPTVPPNFPT